MILHFIPQRRDDVLTVVKSGDTLIINGDVVDLSGVPEGASLPSDAIDNQFVASTVERSGGVLHVTLILPHGPNAPHSARFPEDIIDPPDGEVLLPGEDANGDD